MGTTSTTTTSGTSNTSPWAPAQPYLENILGQSNGAYNQTQQNLQNPAYANPTSFIANVTPQQLGVAGAEYNYGMNSTAPSYATAAGEAGINTGINALNQGAAGLGSFNPAAYNNIGNDINAGQSYAAGVNAAAITSAAMNQADQQAENVTLPGMQRNATAAGDVNSTASQNQQTLLQSQLAQAAAGIYANTEAGAYATGAGLGQNIGNENEQAALSQYGTLGSLGESALSGGITGINSGIADQATNYGLAGQAANTYYAASELPLENQLQAAEYGQSSPYYGLDNLAALVDPIAGLGNQTAYEGETQYTPSMLASLGAYTGLAGALL